MSHPIDTLEPSNSLLFLGAGFSVGAKSIAKEEMPAGNPLKAKLAALLNVPPSEYDLQTLAQEFTNDDGERLHDLLYNTFTVSELMQDQKDILSLPWRRIYTTNYDNLIEQQCPDLAVFEYDQQKPRSLPRKMAVHLHGSVRSATPENVLSQLVLKEDTYVQQIAAPSPWLDEFARDVRFSDACLFLGYSLADHHITARLTKAPHSAKKVHFFSNRVTTIFQNRTKEYGTSHEMDRRLFADMCKTLPRPEPASDIRQLRSFRYVDPYADKRPQDHITPPEVFNLVTFGTFKLHRYASSFATNTYVIEREKSINDAVSAIQTARTVLIHSRLGNGKTIFLISLAFNLSERGYKCFLWKALSAGLNSEISLLSKSGKIALIFDSYDQAAEHIARLGSELPEAKFVVTSRSSQQAARRHEIVQYFPLPVSRIIIDLLSEDDATKLRTLLNQAGLYNDEVRSTIDSTKEFRDIVSHIFNNEAVTREIRKFLDPMLAEPAARFLLVATQLAKWIGAPIDTDTLDRAGNIDSYATLEKYTDVSADLFIIEENQITTRSSILAEYLIQKVFSAKDICGASYFLLRLAVTRKLERSFRSLLSGLMQVSNLKRLTRHHDDAENQISWLFNNISRDNLINEEPLFWLQYAILMMDRGEHDPAERYLETSFVRARASRGFETYQLDTQAVRIYFEIEAKIAPGRPVERIDKMIDSLIKLLPMIGTENHRFHAVEVLRNVRPFVEKRVADISQSERNILVYYLNLVRAALKSFDVSVRAQTGAELADADLAQAIAKLIG